MSTIIDPELTLRLGRLETSETDRIENYTAAAFMWRGLRQDEALDVARALHWQAVGRDVAAPAAEVIEALALDALDAGEVERLATLLDLRSIAVHGTPCPVDAEAPRFGPSDFARAGRRITHALALLNATDRTAV